MVHTSSEFKDLRTTGSKLLKPGCQLRKICFAIKDAPDAAQVSALPGVGGAAFRVLLHGGCNRLETFCVTSRRKSTCSSQGRHFRLPVQQIF